MLRTVKLSELKRSCSTHNTPLSLVLTVNF